MESGALAPWIVGIEDLRDFIRRTDAPRKSSAHDKAQRLLPVEKPYPLPERIERRIGALPTGLR
ncbi:MAG: DUF4291 domain-containing protein [Armatimonadetes bacterium]|nr:DUF4291 domain-containing protein [Armatimonadota bacterium]